MNFIQIHRKSTYTHIGLLSFLLLPLTAVHAAPATLKDFLFVVTDLFDIAIGLVMMLALLAFVWGGIRFIATSGDDKSRADGRKMMIWGTVALFLMVSIWGVVRIIKLSFFGAG